MTRDEYLAELQKALKRMDEGDRRDVLEYYTEYFDEAGPEQEEKVMQELGSPKQLAAQIRAQSAMKEAEGDPKNGRKSIRAVWIGVGAAFGAPVAVPLAAALALVVVALMLVLLTLLAAFYIMALALAASAVLLLGMSFFVLFHNPPTFVLTLGVAVLFAGLAGLIFVPTLIFSRFCFRQLALMVNRIILGRDKK